MTPAKETTKHPAEHAERPAAASHTAHTPAAHSAPAAAHKAPVHKGRYIEAVGRRKTAIARVRIFSGGKGTVHVNGKEIKKYFTLPRLVAAAVAPMEQLKITDLDVTVMVSGGGIHAQAEALRLGLSRAIITKDPEWKPRLRAVGFVTRDSRMVERKKYGLRKARRRPQWAKR